MSEPLQKAVRSSLDAMENAVDRFAFRIFHNLIIWPILTYCAAVWIFDVVDIYWEPLEAFGDWIFAVEKRLEAGK